MNSISLTTESAALFLGLSRSGTLLLRGEERRKRGCDGGGLVSV